MILKELSNCYDMMINSKKFEVARFGYSFESVSFKFTINEDGLIKQIVDLREKRRGVNMEVPVQMGRSVGIFPYLLCDTSKYFLGYQIDDKSKELKNYERNFVESKKLHDNILSGTDIMGYEAVIKFFNNREENLKIVLEMEAKCLEGGRIVFNLENEREYVHNYSDLKNRIQLYKDYITVDSDIVKGTCLISGDSDVPISRLHQKINGVARC